MRTLFAVASVGVLFSGYAAAQQPPPVVPLQAEIETVYTLADGKEVRTNGHFYRSRSGQVREDSALGAVITDLAAGTVTVLVSETKEARVITIPPEQRARPARSNRPVPEVFEESTVDGRRISKARAHGPQGQNLEFWTAKDLGVVTRAKTEAPGLTTVKELRNISTDEPSQAMFAIPGDYRIVDQEAPSRGNGGGAKGVPPRPGPPKRQP